MRRQMRVIFKQAPPTPQFPQSQFEYIIDHPTLDQLNSALIDISTNKYRREVKFIGPLPPGYTVPDDVRLDPAPDYSIAYHISISI